ncbi:alpha/beta hydrolase family protein [Paenibacillus campinasensis]|uniref:Acetylhydrolase n=1 Tax=Paenibacillus campinasensis TaxID=66347 RepID=A0A268EPG2_9BACL|nr:acetylhydrolase [Paenibacillus campinasensis]PAD74981.1 acetylhydrolase [Paenibacillus campinasensis]
MRTFEILLLIVNLGLLIICTLWPSRHPLRLRAAAAGITALLSMIQMVAEGFRWQMIPVYAASVLLGLSALDLILSKHKRSRQPRPGPRFGIRWLRTCVTVLLLVMYTGVSVALPSLLPVFAFATPSGPHGVGTTSLILVDERRDEPHTEDPSDHRRLALQIWYPASVEERPHDKRADYIEHLPVILEGLEQAISIPPFLMSQLRYVKTHAYWEAEVALDQERYPVLLFSHGLTGFRNQNTFQVEDLASRGYIVVGIDHPYDAAAVVFPDHTAMLKLDNLSGFEAYEAKNRLWVEDIKFVLDYLERVSPAEEEHFLSGRMDMDKVGMFGHSFGGATAAQMLMEDPRIKASLNMDGALYGQPIPEEGFDRPYMQMNADTSIDYENFVQSLDEAIEASGSSREEYEAFWAEMTSRRNHAASGDSAYSIVLAKADHMSFTDFYLFSPLLALNSTSPRQLHHSVNEVTAAFFDQYVKGEDGISIERTIDSLHGITAEQR